MPATNIRSPESPEPAHSRDAVASAAWISRTGFDSMSRWVRRGWAADWPVPRWPPLPPERVGLEHLVWSRPTDYEPLSLRTAIDQVRAEVAGRALAVNLLMPFVNRPTSRYASTLG
jgi:hypothetical protein